MRLGQTQLPRDPRILDGRERRGTGAAGVAADEDLVRIGFRHPGRNRADTHFRHELDGYRRIRTGIFQIKNELRQIFDGIDVVVRRR